MITTTIIITKTTGSYPPASVPHGFEFPKHGCCYCCYFVVIVVVIVVFFKGYNEAPKGMLLRLLLF